MKIGVIAASGKAGKFIVDEALSRSHELVAIVRNASKVTQDVKINEKDIFDLSADDLRGFEVVINVLAQKVRTQSSIKLPLNT